MKKPVYRASVMTDIDVFNDGLDCLNYGCVWETKPESHKIIWYGKKGIKSNAAARRHAEKHIESLAK